MRIAIITENFLPKLDGVTRTVARVLEHLQATGHQALLLGPESGMAAVRRSRSDRYRRAATAVLSRTQGKPVPSPVLASPEGVPARGDSPGRSGVSRCGRTGDGPYVARARGHHLTTPISRRTVSILVLDF